MTDPDHIANAAVNAHQEKFGRGFLFLYLIITLLFLIRFLPLLKMDARLWGFNHLLFLPPVVTAVYAALAVVALALPFFSFSAGVGDFIVRRFSAVFFESGRKYFHWAVLASAAATLFVIFPAPTHFLGDGYSWLANLSSPTGTIFKWSEWGTTLLLSNVQALLGPKNVETARSAFQVISVLSGVISIWVFLLISRLVSEDPTKKILVFLGMFMSGGLLLFFGYVENYPLIWVSFTGYIYFGLRYLNKRSGLLLAAAFLVAGFIIHLQMVIAIPAFLYLLLHSRAGLELYRHRPKTVWAILSTIALFGIIVFTYKYTTDLYFESIFLPLLKGGQSGVSYAMFSLPHIIDIINELLLLSPLILLFLLPSAGRLKILFKQPDTAFLALISITGFAFLFVIDGTLGMARDWDLFSICAFAPTLVFIMLFNENYRRALNRVFLPMLILWITAPVAFLVTNLQTEPSLEYHKYCLNLDKKGSFSSLVTLRDYYRNLNDNGKVDSLNQLIGLKFPNETGIFKALDAVGKNDLKTARKILNAVTPNKFSSDYHNLLGSIYLREGNYEKAVDELEDAVQLQKYNPNLLSNLALAYANHNQLNRSYEALKRGYKLDRRHAGIVRGLADYHLLCSRFDSALYYAERLVSADSTRIVGYFMLARIHIKKADMQPAKKYIGLYLKYGKSDPMYGRRSTMLLKLLESQQKKESGTK
ncbi:MAG: hypothetical protein JSU69_07320 [Candidatus Zixiibacteriota bacterium]|nr:MAG: hypothetical protein JSU69_07320 [candidate division Zixibacteria bacterium]